MICNNCGVVIQVRDLENETAFTFRELKTLDGTFRFEIYTTLCEKCYFEDTFAEWCDDEELNT